MNDLAQRAREVWDRIIKQRQMIQGGYEVPCGEPLAVDFILQALLDVREADAKVIEPHVCDACGGGSEYAAIIRSQGVK